MKLRSESIVVIGSSGFVGSYLSSSLKQYFKNVYKTSCRNSSDIIHLDLSKSDTIEDATRHFKKLNIKYAIICSAISSTEQCFNREEFAYTVNVDGTTKLLEQLTRQDIYPFFFSTDRVFDGKTDRPAEIDDTNPSSIYGKHKSLVENWLLKLKKPYAILRCTKIISSGFHKSNIISTIAKNISENKPFNCVADQYIAPIFLEDILKSIIYIIQNKLVGVFHLSGPKNYTRIEITNTIAKHFNVHPSSMTQCKFSDLNLKEEQPKFCTLNNTKLPFFNKNFEDQIKSIDRLDQLLGN